MEFTELHLRLMWQAEEDPSFKPSGGRMGESDMDYDADLFSSRNLREFGTAHKDSIPH